jgi:hypothetical protein
LRMRKSGPKSSPIHFLWKLIHNFYRGSVHIICSTCVCIFHKNFVPKVDSYQIGGNSPNLVTLFVNHLAYLHVYVAP